MDMDSVYIDTALPYHFRIDTTNSISVTEMVLPITYRIAAP